MKFIPDMTAEDVLNDFPSDICDVLLTRPKLVAYRDNGGALALVKK
jgi:hypothetical protein